MSPSNPTACDFHAIKEVLGRSFQLSGGATSPCPVKVLRSYVKWPGAKGKLASTIAQLVPPNYHVNRLIEPFVGSGAVALNFHAERYLLADINSDVMTAHRHVVANPHGFIHLLEALFIPENNTAERFLQLRDEFNGCPRQSLRRATLFVFLNRHGFNGLTRYSLSGRYNVPFGRIPSPYLPRAEVLAFSKRLGEATLVQADFRTILDEAGVGDLAYCDPPYLPTSSTANFTQYATGGFSHQDHEDLAEAAKAAAERGALVILSNHDTPVARSLYASAAKIHGLEVTRTIAAKGSSRGRVSEIMAVYHPDAVGYPTITHRPAGEYRPSAGLPASLN